jgi:hypothetical protein
MPNRLGKKGEIEENAAKKDPQELKPALILRRLRHDSSRALLQSRRLESFFRSL